jgi:hypothetical protein
VILGVEVLHPAVVFRIPANAYGGLIVTEERSGRGRREAKFREEIAEPGRLRASLISRNQLSLGSRLGYNWLSLAPPSYQTPP